MKEKREREKKKRTIHVYVSNVVPESNKQTENEHRKIKKICFFRCLFVVRSVWNNQLNFSLLFFVSDFLYFFFFFWFIERGGNEKDIFTIFIYLLIWFHWQFSGYFIFFSLSFNVQFRSNFFFLQWNICTTVSNYCFGTNVINHLSYGGGDGERYLKKRTFHFYEEINFLCWKKYDTKSLHFDVVDSFVERNFFFLSISSIRNRAVFFFSSSFSYPKYFPTLLTWKIYKLFDLPKTSCTFSIAHPTPQKKKNNLIQHFYQSSIQIL